MKELIERIVRLENDFSSQIGINLQGRANSTAYLISMQETLQDCKSALTQQQEAEPVAYLSIDRIGERYLCFSKPQDNDEVHPLYLR